jgi:sarcosine oxidase subunit delta
MLRLPCPHCGLRDESEFRYRGADLGDRPAESAGEAAMFEHVYLRDNPRGQNREFWLHVYGCGQVLAVTRDTLSHEVVAVSLPGEPA